MDSLRSYRFRSYCLGLGVMTGLTVLAIFKCDLTSIDGPLGLIAGVVIGQLAAGNMHDAKVRSEAIKAKGNAPTEPV